MNENKMHRKWIGIIIRTTALLYSPEKVAHKLYHFYKGYDDNLALDIKSAKLSLRCDFMWEEDKIAEFEKIFNRLTKYVRKNI